MESICALYHDFPVETVEGNIQTIDLVDRDADTLSKMMKYAKMEIYEPRRYALHLKDRCESTGDDRYMKEEEKIWLRYED
jgi:hypothetical protein